MVRKETAYVCEVCSKPFSNKGMAEKHERTLKQGKPYLYAMGEGSLVLYCPTNDYDIPIRIRGQFRSPDTHENIYSVEILQSAKINPNGFYKKGEIKSFSEDRIKKSQAVDPKI